MLDMVHRSNNKTVLLEGEPRDAAANFDSYRILQRHHTVYLQQHGFLSQYFNVTDRQSDRQSDRQTDDLS